MPPAALAHLLAAGPRSHSRHRRAFVAAGRAHALVGRLAALTLSSSTDTRCRRPCSRTLAFSTIFVRPASTLGSQLQRIVQVNYLPLSAPDRSSHRIPLSSPPTTAGMRRPPSLGTYTSVRDPCLMSQYTAFSLNHADPVRAARVFLVLEYYPARDVSAYLGPIPPCVPFVAACTQHRLHPSSFNTSV